MTHIPNGVYLIYIINAPGKGKWSTQYTHIMAYKAFYGHLTKFISYFGVVFMATKSLGLRNIVMN